MARLAGKVALVTGAASGIGRATAIRYAAEGARVFATDVQEDALAQTIEGIRATGGAVSGAPFDVSRPADCAALVEAAAAWGGALHVLGNIAGVGQFAGTVETLPAAEWDRVIAINLSSIFHVSQHAVPHLRAARGSVILNIASPHAYSTTEGCCAYAASKGGVLALSRQMAIDLVIDRIRVIAVIPGAVDTPMLHSHAARQNTTVEALGFSFQPTKLPRVGSPEEVANAMAWLASDEASFVTGAPMFVDGGALAHL